MSDDEIRALYNEKVRYLLALRDLEKASTAMLTELEKRPEFKVIMVRATRALRQATFTAAQALGGNNVEIE